MILQAIPTEDYEDEEGDSLVPGNGERPAASSARRVTAADHRKSVAEGEDEYSWKIVALGICVCLGVVGVAASLAVLSKVGIEGGSQDADTGKGSAGSTPLFAIFSFGVSGSGPTSMPTNNALAWVGSTLLEGGGEPLLRLASSSVPAVSLFQPSLPAAHGGFLPDDVVVHSWRPAGGASSGGSRAGHRRRRGRGPALQSVALGPVSEILKEQHGLGRPQVANLAAGQGIPSVVPGELPVEDAFLRIRLLLSSSAQGGRDPSEAPIVLVCHPHQLPFLAILARAVGFSEVSVLDPQLFDAVPWSTFGCDQLGYGPDSSAEATLAHEASRLDSYVGQLREIEPERYTHLEPAIRVANATLRFHRCVAKLVKTTNDTAAARLSRLCSSELGQ
ncbi:unnamed protein product, partial [Polarella glacialis]